MSNFDIQYQRLLKKILNEGQVFETRGTKSKYIFGCNLKADLRVGFPALQLRNVWPESAISELLWDIHGLGDISKLKSNGLKKVWENYAVNGVVENSYSKAWRDWNGTDQLLNIFNEIKISPTSRTHVLQSYNPLMTSGLKQCAPSMCFSSDGTYLSLAVFCRSLDLILGCPGDFIRYGTLLSLMAKSCNLIASELYFSIVNAHVYEANINDANNLVSQKPVFNSFPRLEFDKKDNILDYQDEDLSLINYNPSGLKLGGKMTIGDLSYIK